MVSKPEETKQLKNTNSEQNRQEAYKNVWWWSPVPGLFTPGVSPFLPGGIFDFKPKPTGSVSTGVKG
jgi:hypothetical protein